MEGVLELLEMVYTDEHTYDTRIDNFQIIRQFIHFDKTALFITHDFLYSTATMPLPCCYPQLPVQKKERKLQHLMFTTVHVAIQLLD